MVFFTLGQIIQLEGILLLFPAAISLLYREDAVWSFLITVGIAAIVGTLLVLLNRPGKNQDFFAKEGFVIVALAWIAVSGIGALPFVISREIPSFVDALFETVSGFTTTGSSILEDVEQLSRGILFWRSFTHWIGGMGVLVLIMAIIPTKSGRSMHILRAEMPGLVVGKLVPRVRDTAKILYLIYLGMTVTEIILLICGGMSLFDSAVYSFGTAGTGGFGIHPDSVGGYSPYCQWVIAVFMLLFGVNFNLYFLILAGHLRSAIRSRELRWYIGIAITASAVIVLNTHSLYAHFGEAVRTAFFQVSSIITTTGYATVDFARWPALSQTVLFALMFIGGWAGSTAGGLKVSRVLLLLDTVKRDLRHLIHPRSVGVIRLEGKRADNDTIHSASAYFVAYCAILLAVILIVGREPFGLESNITAAVTCLNNVGPGLGKVIGPAGNFQSYSDLSKIALTFAMLFGRLEIYPLLITLIPSTWTKK